jgi:hypothetical protein
MFRRGLLTTTALVIVGSLSFLASQAVATGRPLTARSGRDKNQEFLCAYGQFNVSGFQKQLSVFYSDWTHVAVPFVGNGKTFDRIVVKEGQSSYASSTEFSAAIYTNTRHGAPGKRIAGGVAHAPPSCEQVSISIPATNIKKGKKYWVVESIPTRRYSGVTELYWAIDPKMKQRAYIQYHRLSESLSYSNSFTSPWMQESAGPYVKLK